jgi:hypothetical protein
LTAISSFVSYVQSLKDEFRQQETLLKGLEEHVTQYRQQGKMEAASRLEQQTQLLKVRSLPHTQKKKI